MKTAFIPLLFAIGALPAGAQSLAFVEASSELDDGRPRSYAYNLIDGKDTTAWCSKPSPSSSRLVFGFNKRATVTEIGIVVGAIKGGKLDKRRMRAKELVVSDGQVERTLPLTDTPGMQKIKLNPPATARMLVVEIRDFYAGDSGTPLCIGEIHLKGKRVYTHSKIASEVRALPTPARRMLHAWVDDPGAPERSLVLSLNGNFYYEYRPLMEGKPVKIVGKWKANHRNLTLEWRGKKYKLRKRLTETEGDFGASQQLSLQGDAPHSSMNTDLQIAPANLD